MRNSSLISNLRTLVRGDAQRRPILPYIIAAVMAAYVIVLLYLVASDVSTTSAILRGM